MSSPGIAWLKDKPHLLERFFSRPLPFDHLVIGYCWIIIILTVNFARPLAEYTDLLLFHAGVIVLAFALAHLARSESNRFVMFFRLLYPALLVAFFYRFSGKLVGVIVPQFFDAQVIGIEQAVFGIEPTIWLDQHLSVALTEVMSAGYFSYYLLIPGLALALFFGRRDDEIKRFMTASCVTFFMSYIVFILYPVEGPRFHFAGVYQNQIYGVLFRPLVELVIKGAAFRGGAMPSSHVAEAMVVLLFALRNYRRRAYFLIPVVVGLALGTVYGRFHYVTDVVIGAAAGAIIYWMTIKLYPKRPEVSQEEILTDFYQRRRYVSNSF